MHVFMESKFAFFRYLRNCAEADLNDSLERNLEEEEGHLVDYLPL